MRHTDGIRVFLPRRRLTSRWRLSALSLLGLATLSLASRAQPPQIRAPLAADREQSDIGPPPQTAAARGAIRRLAAVDSPAAFEQDDDQRDLRRIRALPPEANSSGQRSEELPSPGEPSPPQPEPAAETIWWKQSIYAPLRASDSAIPITLEQLLTSALQHSPDVQVIKEIPLIRQTSIMEADAQFDWITFVESQWADLSQPVGNVLTTGGPNRFRDDNFTSRTGVRRRNTWGGQVEVGQEIGHQNTNSDFFTPKNQGTSQLTINYTQPLWRNAGRAYNTALTVLAEIETEVGMNEFSKLLQDQLVAVSRTYWQLYLKRGELLQKRRLLAQAEEVLDQLEQRQEIDALLSQILKARSAVRSRRAEIFRAETEVKSAETRLRALVNDPALGDSLAQELIPTDVPTDQAREVDLDASVDLALQARPEISQALQQIKAAGVRLSVAKNEKRPALNLVMETYASGLRGNSDIGGAIINQYSVGEPSYTIGLVYEYAPWNRAAKARYDRRRHELKQLEERLRSTMLQVQAEVVEAVLDVATTYQEMRANYESVEAAKAEVDYIYDRWQWLPSSDRSASLLLEDLLEAQKRLNDAEFAYLNAQREFSVSQFEYLRVVGTLLQSERISLERYCESYLPGFRLYRSGARSRLVREPPAEEPKGEASVGHSSAGDESPERPAG